ncbi:DUF2335 domain-containing protein [Corynebacterium lizhenjunii]|uniref:DUF2335 domain-containing protein n=1 Tax=Corynebacterium lizhenjunii TaxID=2709394 RepID=UPI0013EBC656|nr:DUF2335 domain-containing protein [Corynebacterium lizhenjunii]
MTDEHSTHEEDKPQSSDSPIQRRAGYPSSSDTRSDGKRGESLATNGTGSPGRDGLSTQDEVVEAEFLDQVSDRVTSQLLSVTRIAPLPEPGELQAYERIQQGLADRIVQMAENSAEAANAATNSNAAVNNALAESILEDGRSLRRGQWMFFTLAVLFLVTAVGLEFSGRTPFATGMGILGFLSLVGVVIRPKTGPRWSSTSKDEYDSAAAE